MVQKDDNEMVWRKKVRKEIFYWKMPEEYKKRVQLSDYRQDLPEEDKQKMKEYMKEYLREYIVE